MGNACLFWALQTFRTMDRWSRTNKSLRTGLLILISNYGMSFVPGLIPPGICLNFVNFLKEKTENLVSSASLKKLILSLIFFSINFSYLDFSMRFLRFFPGDLHIYRVFVKDVQRHTAWRRGN